MQSLPRASTLALLSLLLATAGCTEADRAFTATANSLDNALSGVREALKSDDTRYEEAKALQRSGDADGAVAIYRALAADGHAEAAYEIGRAYETGRGAPRDAEQAAAWYNTAANRGSARAQYLVGLAYADGAGVPRDLPKAARFFGKAAVQGHAPSQYRLGRAFANGEGVAKDNLWAGRWYGKSALQGNVDAQFAYGALLAAGRGMPRDLPLAHAYLSRAGENGYRKATDMTKKLETRMTEDDVREARAHYAEIAGEPAATFADPPTVRYVQAALSSLGIDAGPADGRLGPSTRNGIREFQQSKGMTADGRLSGPLLEALLQATRA